MLMSFISCSNQEKDTPAQKDKSLTSYVNTFIGTGGHGYLQMKLKLNNKSIAND